MMLEELLSNMSDMKISDNDVAITPILKYDLLKPDTNFTYTYAHAVNHGDDPEYISVSIPVATTFTIEGKIGNIAFHEMNIINELVPTIEIQKIGCNYGVNCHALYVEPKKIRKSNRGRKVKIKTKKRKIQGTGTYFNSQITMVAVDTVDNVECVTAHANDNKVLYKFKIFRNGDIQLPGAKPDYIEHVSKYIHVIADIFSESTAVVDKSSPVTVERLSAAMLNYKFVIRLNERTQNIDLSYLARRIALDVNAPEKMTPRIFSVDYSGENTRIAIFFKTPTEKKATRKTLLKIFRKGKINILGACDERHVVMIHRYIVRLIEEDRDNIIKNVYVPAL